MVRSNRRTAEANNFAEQQQEQQHDNGQAAVKPSALEKEKANLFNEMGDPEKGKRDDDGHKSGDSSHMDAVFEAELVIDDEEDAYRRQVEKEAEKEILGSLAIHAAEELDPEDLEKQARKKKRWYICFAMFWIVVILAVVLGVVFGIRNKNKKNEEPEVEFDPALSQDLCENAVDLETSEKRELFMTGFTSNATVDDTYEVCSELEDNGRGVWYRIPKAQNTQTRLWSIDLCENTDFDTQISIFQGESCDSNSNQGLICLHANDQRSACGRDSSQLYFQTEPDATYFILVHGKRSSTGIFSLRLQEEEDHSRCSSAKEFFDTEDMSGATVFGTTTFLENADIGVDEDGNPLPECGDIPINTAGMWFTFSAKSARFVQIRVDDYPGSRVTVYTGDGCGSLQCVGSGESLVMFTTSKLVDYFILVHSPGKGVKGDFTVNLLPGGLLVPDPDAPTNVQCELAAPITAFPTSITASTEKVSPQTPLQITSCGNLVFTTAPGLWYSVTGTGGGMRASTCEIPTSSESRNLDTQISVFTGSCSELACVGGGDQNCGDQSSVAWYSSAGQTYYVLVQGVDDRVGEFTLTVDLFESPSVDECTTSTMIGLDGVSVLGTTVGANPQNIELCNANGDDGKLPTVWYSVVGTGSTMLASTCDPFSFVLAGVEVYQGSGCLDTLQCLDSTIYMECLSQKSVLWNSQKDEIYTLQVYGMGAFTLAVEDVHENFLCPNASEDLQLGASTVGFTKLVSAAVSPRSCQAVGPSEAGSWYRVRNEVGGPVTLSACSDITNFNTYIRVFEGSDCGNLGCVADNNGLACGSGSSVTWDTNPNEEYLVLVQGSEGGFGNFELSLGVENDLCEEAIPIAADGSITLGSTVGATRENWAPFCFESEVIASGPSVWYVVIGGGSLLTASTCSSQTDFDTQLSVFSGTSCLELTCIAGSDNGCDQLTATTWFAELGNIYRILVHGNTAGNFGLTVSATENDVCDASLPLSTDASSVRGVTSTKSPPPGYFDSCLSQDINLASSWYSVEGTGTEVTIDACSSGLPFSPISIFSSDCSALTCVESTQGDCSVTFDSEYGEEYRLVLNGDGTNRFALTADASNDQCESAIGPLQAGDVIHGSNSLATNDSQVECEGATSRGAGVWYTLVGSENPITLHTCSPFTDFDTQITAFTGSDCSNLSCVEGKDDNCGIRTWLTIPAAAGEIFHVLVSGKNGSTGNFVLQVA